MHQTAPIRVDTDIKKATKRKYLPFELYNFEVPTQKSYVAQMPVHTNAKKRPHV